MKIEKRILIKGSCFLSKHYSQCPKSKHTIFIHKNYCPIGTIIWFYLCESNSSAGQCRCLISQMCNFCAYLLSSLHWFLLSGNGNSKLKFAYFLICSVSTLIALSKELLTFSKSDFLINSVMFDQSSFNHD